MNKTEALIEQLEMSDRAISKLKAQNDIMRDSLNHINTLAVRLGYRIIIEACGEAIKKAEDKK